MGFNLFTWWTGQTLGTWLKTVLHGREVGRDGDGNIYYTDRRNDEGRVGRRWVIYAGDNEATRIPPDWFLWLHGTSMAPPSDSPLQVRQWAKPSRPNPTGSPRAELPAGALAAGGKRSPAAADYRPWTPGMPAQGIPGGSPSPSGDAAF